MPNSYESQRCKARCEVLVVFVQMRNFFSSVALRHSSGLRAGEALSPAWLPRCKHQALLSPHLLGHRFVVPHAHAPPTPRARRFAVPLIRRLQTTSSVVGLSSAAPRAIRGTCQALYRDGSRVGVFLVQICRIMPDTAGRQQMRPQRSSGISAKQSPPSLFRVTRSFLLRVQ